MRNLRPRADVTRKPTNVSIRRDLLDMAKALKINLSRTLEERLSELVSRAERERWLMENREALEAYNHRIERRGVFSDGLRRF
jgi:antitoxin CcdA